MRTRWLSRPLVDSARDRKPGGQVCVGRSGPSRLGSIPSACFSTVAKLWRTVFACEGGGGVWTRILQECHDRPLGRYLCPRKTAAPVRRPAYRRQTHDVDAYVRSCEVCQRAKADHVGPRGLLHPLPLPSRLGGVIGVDWLMGLMTSDHQ